MAQTSGLRLLRSGCLRLGERYLRSAAVSAPATSFGSSIQDAKATRKGVVDLVEQQVATGNTGRLFAVVHMDGQQFKVTENDVIILHHNRPLDIGDRIRLEKVLMVGAKDFSLFGRPLLPAKLAEVEATVIEKTLTSADPRFHMVPAKNFHHLLCMSIACFANVLIIVIGVSHFCPLECVIVAKANGPVAPIEERQMRWQHSLQLFLMTLRRLEPQLV
uniref:Large ribosomal subunit protein bL21m n=1 Tax=Plectus sambesii TaxID=2011161 RepID=A0A914UWH4_9BILA